MYNIYTDKEVHETQIMLERRKSPRDWTSSVVSGIVSRSRRISDQRDLFVTNMKQKNRSHKSK